MVVWIVSGNKLSSTESATYMTNPSPAWLCSVLASIVFNRLQTFPQAKKNSFLVLILLAPAFLLGFCRSAVGLFLEANFGILFSMTCQWVCSIRAHLGQYC